MKVLVNLVNNNLDQHCRTRNVEENGIPWGRPFLDAIGRCRRRHCKRPWYAVVDKTAVGLDIKRVWYSAGRRAILSPPSHLAMTDDAIQRLIVHVGYFIRDVSAKAGAGHSG